MNTSAQDWLAIWWPIYSPIVLLLLGGASTGVWAIMTRKGGEKAKRTDLVPPTWPEIYKRMKELEDRAAAAEERADDVRDVFLSYVDRVRDGGSTDLTAEERQRLFKDHHKTAENPSV